MGFAALYPSYDISTTIVIARSEATKQSTPPQVAKWIASLRSQ